MVGQVPATTDHAELVRMMVGRSIEDQFPRRRAKVGEVLLEVKDLSREGVLDDVSSRYGPARLLG